MAHYRERWKFANDEFAANQRAAVWPEDVSGYASIFSDSGLTVPLANPTTTDADGWLEFYAADGTYVVFVGPVNSGDSGSTVTLGASANNPVLSVNGQAPDGGGGVTLDAADVGADPAGSAAAAAAASQPLSTINAKGDLYAGTANDTTTRLGVGANGQVLTANSATGTGLQWVTPAAAPVTSVNGETGVVVLDATDVGADPAGSAAAAAAASQPLATIDAAGDLYVGTGNNATIRLPIGSTGEVLTVVGGTASWEPAPADAVDSVNGQTGVVVLDAGDVGAAAAAHASTHASAGSDPVTLAQSQVTNLTTDLAAKQPLDADLTAIAGLDSSTSGAIASDGAGWIKKTYAQFKTALSLVKGDVGLGNVDNTSDANKPVSTATQTALNGKQDLDSDLTAIAALTPSNDDIIQRKAGAWTNRTLAQYKADLNITPHAMLYVDPTATGWYFQGAVNTVTNEDITSGSIFFTPFYPSTACTMTRFAYEIVRQSVAAAGTDQIAVGIYGSTGYSYGRPTGAPLADFGLFDLEQALGVYVVDPTNFAHPGGLLWWGVGRITSGVVTTSGRIRAYGPSQLTRGLMYQVGSTPVTTDGSLAVTMYSQTGWAGGALPSVGTVSPIGNMSPPNIFPELTA